MPDAAPAAQERRARFRWDVRPRSLLAVPTGLAESTVHIYALQVRHCPFRKRTPPVPDVIIIGAGPAGLTLGCYLARSGIDHLIVDRAVHPRPHVGESLLPACVGILEEIDFLPVVDAAGFPESRGIVYHSLDRKRPVEVAYGEFPQPGVTWDHTYHVDRARFDMLLMKHADSLGCPLLLGAKVEEVLFDRGLRARGVRAVIGDESVELEASLVVDAAGRDTLIGTQLGLRSQRTDLDQMALHAWFEGVDRGRTRTSDHTHVYFLPSPRGWAWAAPINDAITSVGLVVDRAAYAAASSVPAAFFRDRAAENPALAAAMKGAERINDLKGEASYSYRLERICGDGWMAVGDAARFLDPVFSSGVCVALQGARLAAQTIEDALSRNDTSRAALLPYEEGVFAVADVWDDFMELYYRLHQSFIHFVRSTDHRPGILRLLQGSVARREEAPVLDEIRAFVEGGE
jgi:flavin-dependent dehydrogenase